MKFLTALITLAATTTFAAPKTEILNLKGSVSFQTIRCEIGKMGSGLPISERQSTVLEKPYIILGQDAIDLTHVRFSTPDCNLTWLDQLSADSVMQFGYLQRIPITITKETSTSRRDGQGNCFARFTETVKLDIGNDIFLTSETIKPIAMSDCL